MKNRSGERRIEERRVSERRGTGPRVALWNKDGIGLIGRDSFLKKHILPRINSDNRRFIIKGEIGVGKTAVLEWAHEHSKKSAIVSAGMTFGDILDRIIAAWDIKTASKKASEKETEILKVQGRNLYVDDLHKATPKLIKFLKTVNERNRISGAMLSGVRIKEELKYLMWSCRTYSLPRLKRADALRFSKLISLYYGTRLSYQDIANASGGLPGRIVNAARTGEIQMDEVRTRSEEVDVAPLFIMAMACVVIFRYLGRATDATDFVLLGGIGMVGLIFARGLFQKGRER